MADWQWVVTDKAGVSRAFLEPRGLTVTRRLANLGPNEASWDLDLDGHGAHEIIPGSRLVRGYRDGILRVHNLVMPSAHVAEEDDAHVDVQTADPFVTLDHRFLRQANKRRWNDVDQGEIAQELITDQAAKGGDRWYFHLEPGDLDTSVEREQAYDVGKNVREAIGDLMALSNGFWARVDPVAYDSDHDFASGGKQTAAGEFHVLYPASGSDRTTVIFEYGEQSLSTIQHMEHLMGMPTNYAQALADVGDIVRAKEVEHEESQDEFGVWMASESFPDVLKLSTLEAHAEEMLRPHLEDAETITFAPSLHGIMLWDDFDVGDLVRVRGSRGAHNVAATMRVLEVQLSVTDDGDEEITSLTVEMA